MKLGRRLVTIPIVAAIIAFFCVIIFSLLNYTTVTLSNLNDNQQFLVENMVKSVDEYIENYSKVVVHLETMDAVRDTSEYENIKVLYRGLPDTEGLEVRALFKTTLDLYPEIAYLETFTKDAAVNVVLEPYSAQLQLSKDDYLQGFSYRDWYKGAFENDGIYVSEAYVSASIMEPVVAMSTPIYNHAEAVGIMIGAVRLEVLSEWVAELNYGETGICYIMDKNNNIVAHPDTKYFEGMSLFNIDGNEICEEIVKGESLKGTIQLYDDLSGEDVYVFYKKMETTDWYVISQISTREVRGPIYRMALVIILFSLVFIGLYLLFLYWNTNSVVNKMVFLSNISEEVKEGNLDLSKKNEGIFHENMKDGSEVGKLTKNYYEMVFTLNRNFALLKERKNEIEKLANLDPLTKLANRRKFNEVLKSAIEEKNKGAVLLVDIDNFKSINDTLGHIVGDKVLVKLSRILEKISNENIFPARFGGDEFIICLKNIESKDDAWKQIQYITKSLKKELTIDEYYVEITISIGAALFPADSMFNGQLVKFADMALYEAKKNGKNRSEFFEIEMEERVLEKANIEKELAQAIKQEAFHMVYQPQVELDTGMVLSYEALLRLDSGNYSPAVFIPVAEETGQIIEIGRLVVKKTLQQIGIWKKMDLPVKQISVNFSAAQFKDREFIDYLKFCLDEYDVDPKLLEIEITENILMENNNITTGFLRTIKEIGVKISIDDFGTGYSSFQYLANLPIQKIKLDKCISDKLLWRQELETMESLIRFIHSLDMFVVAEGVETKEGRDRLLLISCDIVQGYYFSKPIKAEEVPENMRKIYTE